MKFLKRKGLQGWNNLEPYGVQVSRQKNMKASFNRKQYEVTLKMSLSEYMNLQRIMRNLNGSGDGFVSADPYEEGSCVTKVTTLIFDSELMDTWKYPKLNFVDGNWTFKKGDK